MNEIQLFHVGKYQIQANPLWFKAFGVKRDKSVIIAQIGKARQLLGETALHTFNLCDF
jgi:hypothetical protein